MQHQQPQVSTSSSGAKRPEKIQLPKPVTDFQFKNPTPMANPYGPYFKEMDIPALLRARQNEVEFKTSTLERKHVWQLHLGNDLGLKLDLVDQNAFLNDPNGAPPLSAEDKIFVANEFQSTSRGRGRLGEDTQLPQFFRQTVYIDNDPFYQRNKNQTDDFAKVAAVKKKLIDPSKDIFSADFIDKSFSLVDLTVAKLVKENAKKRKLLWSKPLVPEDANVADVGIKRTIIRFTEDPSLSLGYPTNEVVTEGVENTKRFRVEEGIFMNTRKSADDKKTDSTNITLVAPSIHDEEPEASKYEWVRDFEMDCRDPILDDAYVVALKDSSDQAIFFKISSRFEMKKITMEDSQPHSCNVSRID